jgi:hypothetical protein
MIHLEPHDLLLLVLAIIIIVICSTCNKYSSLVEYMTTGYLP